VSTITSPSVFQKQKSPSFFGVYRDPRTQKNLFFTLLLFPISIGTFVFTVTMFSLSMGLSFTYVGIPIAIAFLYMAPRIVYSIGKMSEYSTEIEFPDRILIKPTGSIFDKIKQLLSSPQVGRSIAYMVLIFPIATTIFVIIVTIASISIGFLPALFYPIFARLAPNIGLQITNPPFVTDWMMTAASFILPVIGFFMLTYLLNVVNGLAEVHAKILNSVFDDSAFISTNEGTTFPNVEENEEVFHPEK